jgi:hypothetical protein
MLVFVKVATKQERHSRRSKTTVDNGVMKTQARNGHPTPADQSSANGIANRDHVEIIRFLSDDAQRQAIRVLLDCGTFNLSSNRLDE